MQIKQVYIKRMHLKATFKMFKTIVYGKYFDEKLNELRRKQNCCKIWF